MNVSTYAQGLKEGESSEEEKDFDTGVAGNDADDTNTEVTNPINNLANKLPSKNQIIERASDIGNPSVLS